MKAIMLGPSLSSKGGIAAVANMYKQCGLFRKYGIIYLATTCDGKIWQKIWQFCCAFVRYVTFFFQYDINFIHIHIASRNSSWRKLFFIAIAVLIRKPFILHLHGGEYATFFYEECGKFRKHMIGWMFRHANCLVALSSQWRCFLSSLNLNQSIYVVHNPVHIGPRSVPRSKPEFNFVFLGRLEKSKGIFILIEALRIIVPKCPHVRLLCGGDGMSSEIRDAVEKAGLNEKFIFLGWVSGKVKNDLLAEADTFVLPSYSEGLPMSILEALASGIPVISTRVGGIPDAIEDGLEGFLVEPGDVDALAARMFDVVNNNELRNKMSFYAYRRAQNFSCEKVISHLESIYANL